MTDKTKAYGLIYQQMKKLIRRSARKLRSGYKKWSAEHDREFFDALFAAQNYNPFSFAYPGYITIRRFADLVTPFLKGKKSVLDIGCGPAEITCELARCFPDIEFLGIDHSAAGIKRAEQNARRLNLKNTVFLVKDAENFLPEKKVDLICLFDAFHHLMDPSGFIRRMGGFTTRFLLIEPRGDWKGAWNREFDLDWLILEMDKIRARIDFITGERELKKPASEGHAPKEKSEPVEQRFCWEDFQDFFTDYGLKVRGTVAGIEAYPPGYASNGESRRRFGEIVYDLYKDVDEKLFAGNQDLNARHWIIYAEKGAEFEKRPVHEKIKSAPEDLRVKGSYDVEYRNYSGPKEAEAGLEFSIQLELYNRSFRSWSSSDPDSPILISYHWCSMQGKTLVQDGVRTPLPRCVLPEEICAVEARVKAPEKAGKYRLVVDLVCEGKAWFSDSGAPCLNVDFRIQ